MLENCDQIFVPRCNKEIWNGENILNSHVRGQDIILQKITLQISKATSAIINVSDLILKMKDSGLQGVSASSYQLQLNNLITCTWSLFKQNLVVIWISTEEAIWRINFNLPYANWQTMQLLVQPYYLETIWLTASDHLILPQVWWNRLRWYVIDKPLVKTKKTSSSPKEALFTGRKGNLARATDYLVAIQLSKIASRSKADTKNTYWLRGHSTIYDLLPKV